VGGRRAQSLVVVFGLLTCSADLVHITHGLIEAHFHFFVMVTLLATYEEWFPYLLAFLYVLVHHGLMGALDSSEVYSTSDGAAHPWRWAAVHALFISALGVVNIAAGNTISLRLALYNALTVCGVVRHSARSTRLPSLDSATDRFDEVVLLPMPPLP